MNASVWDTYPATYRGETVGAILRAVNAGESFVIVGLSGSGKSNLIGFLAHRMVDGPQFILVDCNRLRGGQSKDLLRLIHQALGQPSTSADLLFSLEDLISSQLAAHPQGLCLLLDRLDSLPEEAMPAIAGNLRSLRDSFKYQLTFGIASRRPIPEDTELNELFYGNTFWLGPLSKEDARWSVEQYAQRCGADWDETLIEKMINLSWGYPSLLRGVCEAAAAGAPLDMRSLRSHPAVERRVQEFWRDEPDADAVRRSGLEDHPLLSRDQQPTQPNVDKLTANEYRLHNYFQTHPDQVCTHDELVQAVWKEEKQIEGVRDDRLAQLVRRLRAKIETDPANPQLIQTVPGRGYRYSAN
jgi:ABC-type dipeptide/oligopeptide/nickel transport system ATPase subunit